MPSGIVAALGHQHRTARDDSRRASAKHEHHPRGHGHDHGHDHRHDHRHDHAHGHAPQHRSHSRTHAHADRARTQRRGAPAHYAAHYAAQPHAAHYATAQRYTPAQQHAAHQHAAHQHAAHQHAAHQHAAHQHAAAHQQAAHQHAAQQQRNAHYAQHGAQQQRFSRQAVPGHAAAPRRRTKPAPAGPVAAAPAARKRASGRSAAGAAARPNGFGAPVPARRRHVAALPAPRYAARAMAFGRKRAQRFRGGGKLAMMGNFSDETAGLVMGARPNGEGDERPIVIDGEDVILTGEDANLEPMESLMRCLAYYRNRPPCLATALIKEDTLFQLDPQQVNQLQMMDLLAVTPSNTDYAGFVIKAALVRSGDIVSNSIFEDIADLQLPPDDMAVGRYFGCKLIPYLFFQKDFVPHPHPSHIVTGVHGPRPPPPMTEEGVVGMRARRR